MLALLLLVSTAIAARPAYAQLGSGPPNITPQLVVDGPVRPGSEVDLAILMRPAPGWHGYWLNPGDAGQPMSVEWQLPAGARVGGLRYPVPETLTIAGLMNYVYKGPYAILTRLHVPANASGVLPVRATARWLACTDQICVPERGELSLDVPIGGGADQRARFDEWRRKLPRPLGAQAHFAANGTTVRLGIPLPASVDIGEPHFFPVASTDLEHAAPQRFSRTGDLLIAELTTRSPADRIEGIVALGNGQGLAISAVPGSVPSGGAALGADGRSNWSVLGWAVLGALAGGLLLNLMPCVFPILALKALALARAGGDERHARRDALAYTAGAVAGTGALGIALLLIRAGGSAAGWAFQLQDPRTILLLALLGTAITLNLLGLFKLPVLGGDSNPRGGFATGALAAFVATPCAGPFMGAALGAALLLPAAGALAVFAALGLGIALPFLAVAFIPALRRRLPKPGAWMVRLQRVLAVPMGLSTGAALWLLWRQGGSTALLLGIVAVLLLILVLFLYGRNQYGERRWGWPVVGAAVVGTLVLAVLLPQPAVTSRTLAGVPPWSEASVAAARQQGRPVFVYFTADWCLTCKVNEVNAIDRDAVQDAFRRAKVEVVAGDWTNGDPAITRFLEGRGRAGVPLYLWYAAGQAEPEELPQVLTPAMLIARAQRPYPTRAGLQSRFPAPQSGQGRAASPG